MEDIINPRPIPNDPKLGNFRYAIQGLEFHVVMVTKGHRNSGYSKTVASPQPPEQILIIGCVPLSSMGCVFLISLVGFRQWKVRWKNTLRLHCYEDSEIAHAQK